MTGRLSLFKHLTYALLIFGGILLASELTLRYLDSLRHQQSATIVLDAGLAIPSWSCHHANRPGYSGPAGIAESGEAVDVNTNSFGFRGPELTIPKPAQTFRILNLGSDDVLGARIPAEQTFCTRLEQLLQTQSNLKIEVINAGVPDYCPLLGTLQFIHEAGVLQPDLILYHWEPGDVSDDQKIRRYTHLDEAQNPLACPHPDLSSHLSTSRKQTEWYDNILLTKWGKQRLAGWIPQESESVDVEHISNSAARYAWLYDHPPDWSVQIRESLQPLQHLQQISRSTYAQFAISLIPAPWQISPEACSPAVREFYGIPTSQGLVNPAGDQTLSDFAKTAGIPLHSPRNYFQNSSQPAGLYLQSAPLLSAEGHARYAESLAAFIVQTYPGIWKPAGPAQSP